MEEKHHLTEQEIAKCAEAISNGTFQELDMRIQNHIAECNSCANEITTVSIILDEEQALTAKIDTDTTNNTISIKRKTNQPAIIAFLAAASIILFFGIRFFTHKNETTNSNIAQNEVNDSTITDTLEQPIAEPIQQTKPKKRKKHLKEQPVKIIKPESNNLLAYTPNDQMEKLVERFNNSAMRGEDIEVKSPILIEAKIGELTLEWTNPNKQTMIIEFFNNQGIKISETETTNSLLKPTTLNKQGLYYWKLINEDFDLLFCGKIKLSK